MDVEAEKGGLAKQQTNGPAPGLNARRRHKGPEGTGKLSEPIKDVNENIDKNLLFARPPVLGAARVINELMVKVNASWGRIDKAAQLMSLESPAPLVKQRANWTLTTATLADSFWQRAERLTTLRRAEQQQTQQ